MKNTMMTVFRKTRSLFSKKRLKTLLWAVLTLVLSWAALATIFWGQRTHWPEFPAATKDAPQLVVQIERDYGWRTGDRVPVELFIRQQTGTTIDLDSLAVNGDFEILKQPGEPIWRELPDGSKLYRLQFELQSLAVQKSWSLNANLSYRVLATGKDESAALPGLVLYTSMTYDGRPEIQQGPLTPVFGNELLYATGWLALGLVGVIGSIIWLIRISRNEEPEEDLTPMTPMMKVHHNFKIIWKRIQDGDTRAANYRELAHNLRWLFKIRSRTLAEANRQLEANNDPYHQEVIAILAECDKVLYQRRKLTANEQQQIYDAFQRIFTGQPTPKKGQPPRPQRDKDGITPYYDLNTMLKDARTATSARVQAGTAADNQPQSEVAGERHDGSESQDRGTEPQQSAEEEKKQEERQGEQKR